MDGDSSNKKQVKGKTALLIILILLLLVVIGGTYAFYTQTLRGTEENVIRSANLVLKLDETASSGINLKGALPVDDETGEAYTPYKFSLVNEGSIDSNYTIYLEDLDSIKTDTDAQERVSITDETRMKDTGIKYSLKHNKNSSDVTNPSNLLSTLTPAKKRVLDTGTIGVGETYTYELRLWIKEDATLDEVNGKIFAAKLNIEATFSDTAQ